jgi:CDP-diacylglycerol---glycerol-3-phosphate 3-phosphatidyltransferase
MLISAFVDTLDGLVARRQNATSVFGAFLDSTLDRISDFFYIFGFWILLWNSAQHILASGLIFASSLTTLMISYVKARSQTLGGTCDIGWMERGWRTVFLIIWALLICILPTFREAILWVGLVLYFGLTSVTVLQRIVYCRSEFLRPKE